MFKVKNIFENKVLENNYISKSIINPYRDWIILIVLLFVMIVFSIVFDLMIYQKIVSGEMYVSVKKEELILVNLKKDKLEAIINDFQQKKDYVLKIKIESLIDPSI